VLWCRYAKNRGYRAPKPGYRAPNFSALAPSLVFTVASTDFTLYARPNKIYKIDNAPARLTATGRLLEFLAFEILLDTKTSTERPMQSYHLTDEFTDIGAEQAVLASLIQSPRLYWDMLSNSRRAINPVTTPISQLAFRKHPCDNTPLIGTF